MNIFVGNLAFQASQEDLVRAFAAFGTVASASVVMEKKGLKSRGFGFVQMPDAQEAQAAIAGLNGQEILGRPVDVLPALTAAAGSKKKEVTQLKRTGKYGQGRRSLSYARKRVSVGLPAGNPFKRKRKANPLAWRKKTRKQNYFAKTQSEPTPWKRAGRGFRPWRKKIYDQVKLKFKQRAR